MTKEKSFRIYISRIIKDQSNGFHINKGAINTIDSILRFTATKVVDFSSSLTFEDNKKTISDKEVNSATNMLFSDLSLEKFRTELVSFCKNKCSLYKKFEEKRLESKSQKEDNNQNNENTTSSKRESQTRESKCGLIISVSASEKYLRKFGESSYNVSCLAPVYLASLLEFLSRKLIEDVVNVTSSRGKITISIKHLSNSLCGTPLGSFFDNTGLVILENGLEVQRRRNNGTKTNPETTGVEKETTLPSNVAESDETESKEKKLKNKKKRKPGSKTNSKILQYQQDNALLMQHAPFNRTVRIIADHYYNKYRDELEAKKTEKENQSSKPEKKNSSNNLRFTADFFSIFQCFVEERMVRLLENSFKLSSHAGRETLFGKDISLTRCLSDFTYVYNSVVSDEEKSYTAEKLGEEIPEACLRHIALRAGVKRYGECCTLELRNYILSLLEYFVRDVVFSVGYYKVQTLNSKMLIEALRLKGIHLSVLYKKRKATNNKSKSVKDKEATTPVEDLPKDLSKEDKKSKSTKDSQKDPSKEENKKSKKQKNQEPQLPTVVEAVVEKADKKSKKKIKKGSSEVVMEMSDMN